MAEGFIDVADGRVWYTVAGAGRPGVPLLCLHGGPGMPHDYLEPLAALGDERPVIFYDQLGCGRSPAPRDMAGWTVARFVEELVVVREKLGLPQLVLFGNSWGGMLALQYINDRSPELRGLILSSTPVSVSRWLDDAAQLRQALPADVQRVLDYHERSGYFACPEYQGAVAEYYRRHLCRLSPWPESVERAMNGLGSEVYTTLWGPSEFGPVTGELASFEMVEMLPRISVPTLVTGGRFDEARPEHMALLAESIPGSELAIFENSAHLAFVEEPAAYLARLRLFLAGIDQAA
ncbi:MAG TPA: proline iminopeptidase-family hydrolase [Candidatus Dormibacteraeota bacterium]